MAEGTGLLRAFGLFLVPPPLSVSVLLYLHSELGPTPALSACVRVGLARIPQSAPKSAPNAELAYGCDAVVRTPHVTRIVTMAVSVWPPALTW